jgi:hypothetical protein
MKRAILAAALLVMSAIPASASIAVFVDGRTMKVATYHANDLQMELELMSGGRITVPLTRIDRVVDDEIVTAETVAEVKVIETVGVMPRRSWRYDDTRKPMFKSKFDDTITEAAKHFDIDAALVSAVIKAESDYNPRIVSNKGARGLMQLMPATAERFGVSNSFDPVANIYAGTRYLRWLLKTFDGNADLAVAAYNAGEGNVWKYKGVPPFRETVNYINRIAKHLHRIEPPASAPVASVPVAALSR